jgi:hypothetical protein
MRRYPRQFGEDVLAVLAVALFCGVLYVANPAIGPIAFIVPAIAAVMVIGARLVWW